MRSSRGALSTLLLALLVPAAGCGDGDSPVRGVMGDTPEPGGTAVVVELADMNHPSPLLAGTVFDGALATTVMNMDLLRARWEDGRLVQQTADESPMALARRYEFLGPDSTAIRFHMRSDVRWSDGTPLTAHDVVFTYEWARDPTLSSPRFDYAQYLESVAADNDSTVTFRFTRRYPDMLTHTGIQPIPRHVYEGTAAADMRSHPSILDPANHLVVSGPFRVAQWERGQRVVLGRNPHFQPQAHLDQIVIRIVPEPTTRTVEMQTGAVDLAIAVTFDQIPALRATPFVELERQEKRHYDYIAYNPRGFEPFADPEVRRALGMAIDHEALIRALQMEEYAVPGGGPYAPIFRLLHDPREQAPIAFDPEGARRILEAKGWRDSDGDGILERDGRPFRFTLATNAGNQRRADAVQIVQQQWRRVGVDAQIRVLEFNTLFQQMQDRSFEAVLSGWQVGLAADMTGLWDGDARFNIVSYENPQVTAHFERAAAAGDEESAAPHWRAAAAQIARDQPYTFLHFYDTVHARHERLRGVFIDTYSAYQNSWEWWIPADRRRGGAAPAAAAPADTAGG
jgi:peptide/nickel transport system substrate-binding protein